MTDADTTGGAKAFDIGAQGPEMFRTLLDTSPDAVVVSDESGAIVFVNIQTERLFGYRRDEILGQKVEFLMPPRFRKGHAIHRANYAAAPAVRPMGSGLELYGYRRDGTDFPIEISLSPVVTPYGRLVSASIRDVTERKRLEAAITKSHSYLRSAIESVPGVFGIFDAGDRLVLCNSECRQFFGAALQREIIGGKFADLIADNVAAGTFGLAGTTGAEFTSAWIRYHSNPTGSFDLTTHDGRRWRASERHTAEKGTVITIWDVTTEAQREHDLREARAQAEAASSAKSEFLASMSHELRTPLNAILGFAQLLHRDKKAPLTDRQRERIEYVLKGGEHLLHLIDDVLDLSRIEAGRVPISLEEVHVGEVLADVLATLEPMAARNEITFTVAPLDSALPTVTADRTRFRQVLMNYGSNAIKYGRRGGRAEFAATVHGGVVRVSLTDDGIGIPAEKRDRIFQPFQRAGQETGSIEGTGIGLTITKRLAELMHGVVGFESEHEQGSKFWVELPIHLPEAAAAERPPESGPTPRPAFAGPQDAKFTIVYIEDNPSSIALMEDLMADFERVELLTAPTAEIGIELVRGCLPHAVIMDINLPGISGFEAMRRLREWPETRAVPVVALSAAAMARDASRAGEAGFYRYLTKPVKIDELTALLQELLTQGPAA